MPEAIYVVSYVVNHIIVFDRIKDDKEIKYSEERLIYGHTNGLNCIMELDGLMYTTSLDKSIRIWGKKVRI
jgi:hypothetical protein